MMGKKHHGKAIGIILIVIGIIWLLRMYGLVPPWVWPALLIVLGLLVILGKKYK